MIVTDHDIDVMARTVWGESRNQSWDGQVAVGWVIRNRLEDSAKRYGKSIAEVCQKPYQFSCWLKSDPNLVKLVAVTPADTSFRGALAAAAYALTGLGVDLTHGSRFYKVVGTPANWAAGKTPVVTIGSHEFFNDIE